MTNTYESPRGRQYLVCLERFAFAELISSSSALHNRFTRQDGNLIELWICRFSPWLVDQMGGIAPFAMGVNPG